MAGHYGYIRRTAGADGDQVDVFVRPGTAPDFSGPVFVIDQLDAGGRGFDESKVMLGYDTREAAEQAYRDSYAPDWRGMGKITQMDVPTFKRWISEGDTTQPAADSGMGTLVAEPDITAKAGRPFLTRGAAQRAATEHGNADAVPVEGGFVARPRTGQPPRAEPVPSAAEFGQEARKGFLQMVRQAGGISPDLAADIYGDRAHLANRRAPGLFRRGAWRPTDWWRPCNRPATCRWRAIRSTWPAPRWTASARRWRAKPSIAWSRWTRLPAARMLNARPSGSAIRKTSRSWPRIFWRHRRHARRHDSAPTGRAIRRAVYLSQQGITDVPTQEAIIERASIRADGDAGLYEADIKSQAAAYGRRDTGNSPSDGRRRQAQVIARAARKR